MSGTYFVYIGLLPELRGQGGLELSEGTWLPTWGAEGDGNGGSCAPLFAFRRLHGTAPFKFDFCCSLV